MPTLEELPKEARIPSLLKAVEDEMLEAFELFKAHKDDPTCQAGVEVSNLAAQNFERTWAYLRTQQILYFKALKLFPNTEKKHTQASVVEEDKREVAYTKLNSITTEKP